MKPACEELLHSALEPAEAPPLAEARVSDRDRVGLLLQAGSLLSHLGAAGWRLDRGWDRATVDADGLLRGVRAVPGRRHRQPQRVLADLSANLFRSGRSIAGRGEARRVARALHSSWSRGLAEGSADRAVSQVLDRADFLWRSEFGGVRATLAGVHVWGRERRLWVAGPSWFRRPLLAAAESRRELEERLSSVELGPLWARPYRPGSPAGQLRAAVDRWNRNPPTEIGGRLQEARALFALGRFAAALEALSGVESVRARALKAMCHLWLDRPVAARREAGRLAAVAMSGRRLLEAARVGVEVALAGGDQAAAGAWVERALASVSGWLRPEAYLLAAEVAAAAAAEGTDTQELLRHLRRARVVVEEPSLAWRWYRAAGGMALAGDRPALAAASLERALGAWRRGLPPFQAGLLWSELAVARNVAGDLAGSERAAGHAARLHADSGDPPRTAAAVWRLAEVRLRRGRQKSARDLLARSGGRCRAREVDLSAFKARFELARGRPKDALAALGVSPGDESGEALAGERAALAARALGWLARPDRASRVLANSGAPLGGWFEPEELPALWALAGRRRRALSAAVGPTAAIWTAVLSGAAPGARDWAEIDQLGGYRSARLVYDAELAAPGSCPVARVRGAVAELRRCGAAAMAARLGAADRGSWQALSAFLDRDEPGRAGLAELFAAAGAPQARLWLERGQSRTVLVDGPGGAATIVAPAEAGRLVLSAPRGNPCFPALLRVVADRLPPAGDLVASDRGGMVGESPALLEALRRAAAFANTDLPVLVRGETGTGKELLSRHLHALSGRAEGPFLPLNCAAVARDLLLSDLFGHVRGAFTGADRDRAGIFEAARGGTVFLDEIGDLPLNVQGSLLRVLQEGEVRRVGESSPRRVDTRVLAATHRDLPAMVRRGQFRQDLFFRLHAASVELPPLRQRGRDVLLLADHFLRRLRPGRGASLSRAAGRRLLAHGWPGNVRELENVLAVAVAVGGGAIQADHLELPPAPREDPLGYHALVLNYRRRLVEEALAAGDGTQAAAARSLGVSRQALSYLVKSLAIGG